MNEVNALMSILEFPHLEKSYVSYLEYLKKVKKNEHYNIIKYLIEKKFHDNSTNFNTEQ